MKRRRATESAFLEFLETRRFPPRFLIARLTLALARPRSYLSAKIGAGKRDAGAREAIRCRALLISLARSLDLSSCPTLERCLAISPRSESSRSRVSLSSRAITHARTHDGDDTPVTPRVHRFIRRSRKRVAERERPTLLSGEERRTPANVGCVRSGRRREGKNAREDMSQ